MDNNSSLFIEAALPSQKAHPFLCDLCSQTFSKQSKLKRHIQNVHEDIRPFKCEICSQDYKRKDHLTRHVASVHAQERNLNCPYRDEEGCLLTFPNRDQQRKHILRKHEKKLVCQICQSASIEQQQLSSSIHNSLHGGEQQQQQSTQQSSQFLVCFFQKKSQLRKHMIEVHGDGYDCDHCGKKYAKKKLLNAHLLRVKKNIDLKQSHIFAYSEEDEEEIKSEDDNNVSLAELGDIITKRQKHHHHHDDFISLSEKELVEECLQVGLNKSENEPFRQRYLMQCNSCGKYQGIEQKSKDFMKHITRCWNSQKEREEVCTENTDLLIFERVNRSHDQLEEKF